MFPKGECQNEAVEAEAAITNNNICFSAEVDADAYTPANEIIEVWGLSFFALDDFGVKPITDTIVLVSSKQSDAFARKMLTSFYASS